MPKIVKEISAWFDYPDDPLNGRVHIKYIKPGRRAAITERTSEIVTNYVREFRQSESSFRLNGTGEALAVEQVIAWENFFDENDKPMEANAVNIKKMCLESGFITFLNECQKILAEQAGEIQEKESGN